jgi:methylglutaconyl-CoA hydratase
MTRFILNESCWRFAWSDLDEKAFTALVESHAAKRQSAEAGEGLASFAEKRAGK